jgi:predicted transcriptional regulator
MTTPTGTKPKLERLLQALADEHSLKMFKLASSGLNGGNGAPEKIGLSKKQFYTRLHRLINLGLMERIGRVYKHTTLGSIVNNLQITPLEASLTEYWRLLAIDEIKKSHVIPNQEQEKIAQSILSETALNKHYYVPTPRQNPRIIYTYDELVDRVAKLAESAKTEIFLASRYHDPAVSRLLMKKFEEGVSLNLLDDNPSGTTLVSRLQSAMHDPATRSIAKTILESPRVKIGRSTLACSFMVVDRKYCQFEIVNCLTPNKFNFAVELVDQQISGKLIDIFEKLMVSEKTVRASHLAKQTKQTKHR